MAVSLGCAIQSSLNHGSALKEYDTDCEVFRQRFRQFQYQQAAGPRDAFNNLWELCCQWLMPSVRSKEEILELVVLEQFLNILPNKIETWVRLNHPENRERVLALVEELQKELEMPGKQVNSEENLFGELALMGMTHLPPDTQVESLDPQLPTSSDEATVTQAWMTQTDPQIQNYTDTGEGPSFAKSGYPVLNPDLSFPVGHADEPEDTKDIKQILDSVMGYSLPSPDLSFILEHSGDAEELPDPTDIKEILDSIMENPESTFDSSFSMEYDEDSEELQDGKDIKQILQSVMSDDDDDAVVENPIPDPDDLKIPKKHDYDPEVKEFQYSNEGKQPFDYTAGCSIPNPDPNISKERSDDPEEKKLRASKGKE